MIPPSQTFLEEKTAKAHGKMGSLMETDFCNFCRSKNMKLYEMAEEHFSAQTLT